MDQRLVIGASDKVYPADMKTGYQLSSLTFCLVAFFMNTADAAPVCELNFSSYPYHPSGECEGVQENIKDWGIFPTTLCCQNALTVLSQALAVQAAASPDGNIFIDKQKWANCNETFYNEQHSVNLDSCGFIDLHHGNTKCSALSLSNFREEDEYHNALAKCSQFEFSSFDSACNSCISGIRDLRKKVLTDNVPGKNSTEKAICGVAVIIAVAAGKLDGPPSFTDSFYSCLPAMNVLEPGYYKIKASLAKGIFAAVIALIGIMLVIILVKYVTKYRPPKPAQSKEISSWSGLYRFTKAEIENAINFSGERKNLGRGSAGQVYKGILPSGQVVAIKHIFKSNTSDSFTREVEGLSRVRHPNLVCLFGYCVEGGEQYLVYEYCSAGNLAQHLLRKDRVLSWDRRVKILRDCALALRYLHHYIDGCIVHRDIKLTNILLTDKLEPKLSDFGLAKMLGMEESKVFTDVRGTIGYMDPEYMSNAKLTCASDMYSLGIVALQLLSGQKVIELDLDARDQLTRKAKDVALGRRPLTDFEDPRLNGKINPGDFESILHVAVLCVAKSSKGRPTIDVVYDEIDKAWKNTEAHDQVQEAKRDMSSSATSLSTSQEVFPV